MRIPHTVCLSMTIQLSMVLASATYADCPADINNDQSVDGADLGLI